MSAGSLKFSPYGGLTLEPTFALPPVSALQRATNLPLRAVAASLIQI